MVSISGAGTLGLNKAFNASPFNRYPISCSSYNWTTFYKRQGLSWGEDLDFCIRQFAETGLTALEASFENAGQVKALLPYLEKYKITMPSAYVNSILHEPEKAVESIEQVTKIAEALKSAGTHILVTNPTPVAWGKMIPKTDRQIALQTDMLNRLGSRLKSMGMQLAYHTHDSEMAAGATEFHHVLQNTDSDYVGFCLDAHWIYRGCNDSHLAVFDVIRMYGDRIIELHIRQSINGIWTETIGPGDIDYIKMASIFKASNIRPHLVIEQAVESGTPNTMGAVEAHKIDLQQVEQIFKPIL